MSCKDMFGRDYPLANVKACVGPGWHKLVEELYVLCEEHGVEIHQVKEKFGGLRFYVGPAPAVVHDAIDQAEDQSLKTCEVCGRRGKPRPKGWIKTLCWYHNLQGKYRWLP